MRTWPEWFAGLHEATALAREGGRDTATRLRVAREFIDAHYGEAIDLDAVAREAAVSRYHFLRLFRDAYDVTPHQYLTQRRIAAAKHLLESSDLSVTEVCLEVGFSSLGSFSQLFSRRVGHSPDRYRRRVVQSLGVPLPPRIPSCFSWAYAGD